MELKDRLGSAIVAMLIGLMWTALLFGGIWLAFGWLVESFGREVAIVTTFAIGGVVLAIVLWVASSRHTTSIWRSALSFAADTQEYAVQAQVKLSGVAVEQARTTRLREQTRGTMEVASYKAALADARQQERERFKIVMQQERTQALAPTWAMGEEEPADSNFRRID